MKIDLVDGGILAHSEGLFEGYHQRPKSTAEAFTSNGFCQTGHHARIEDTSGFFWPQPHPTDAEFEKEVYKHIARGPKWETLGMAPTWHVKKVRIRKYWFWRPKKGYKIWTKKDTQNALHLRYISRYKRQENRRK